MIASATVETLTKERRIDSPQGCNGARGGVRLSRGRSPAGRRYHFVRRFVNLDLDGLYCRDSYRLLAYIFTGSFVLGCGNSSVGRAQPCQGWGRGFESRFPLWIGGLTDRRTGGPVDERTRETRNDAVSPSASPADKRRGVEQPGSSPGS